MKCLYKIPLVLFCLLYAGTSADAETFRFKYREGDVYRVLSAVNEDVFINGQFSHKAEILNRISVRISSTDEVGNGMHEAVFMTSEQSTGAAGEAFSWGKEYNSVFARTPAGKYIIDDRYFMPVVRDVPLFPEKDLRPGDTWTAEGYEAHDLRVSFDMPVPFRVPFAASYTYEGVVEENGRTLHKIGVRYNMYFDSPAPDLQKGTPLSDFPASTMGYSNQTIYWDNDLGQIAHYNEDFRIIIETALGNVFEFKGTAHAETDYIAQDIRNNEKLAEVKECIRDLGIANADVALADEGLTISLEDIQFKADSSELEESEKEKLKKIARILEQFPDNDLLVSGHTAMAGTEEARQVLSEKRAAAVASYLVELGVRDKYHIFARGFGADRPAAGNASEEDKARNRRVEITIMDK